MSTPGFGQDSDRNEQSFDETTGNEVRGESQEEEGINDKQQPTEVLQSTTTTAADNIGPYKRSSSQPNALTSSVPISEEEESPLEKQPSESAEAFQKGTFVIRAPPVPDDLEYVTYDYDPQVSRVIRESTRLGCLSYIVQYRDGNKLTLTFEDLIRVPGGSEALDRYNHRSNNGSNASDPLESDSAMVSERARRSKRQRTSNFVDILTVDLSEEDELNHSDPVLRRSIRTRGLLSSHNAHATRRPARHEETFVSSNSSEDSESEASQSEETVKKRLSIRTTRSAANARVRYDEILSSASSASGSDEYHGGLGKRKRRMVKASAATRKSERSGRTLGSMREIGEDDIQETGTRTSSRGVTKATGAKETFKNLPSSDDFRLRHCQTCDTCNVHGDSSEKGRLIFCQGCTSAYHQICLGPRNGREHLVTKVGHQDFALQCRRCVGAAKKREATAPSQGKCQSCNEVGLSSTPFRERKTAREEQKEREDNDGDDPIATTTPELINNPDNVMFRCTGCYQAFHMHHLPSRNDKGSLTKVDNEQVAAERFGEYCRDWICHDCLTAPGEIEHLVAWRPVDLESYISGQSAEQVDEDDKEYLIKWKNMSYYRTTWKGGPWVWGMTHRSMRNAFVRQQNGVNLPKLQTEDAIPEDYLRVDIVFEVDYTSVVSIHSEEVDLARVKEVARARVKFKGLGYEDVVWEEPPDPENTERWADFKAAYEDWVHGHYVQLPVPSTLKTRLAKVRTQKFDTKVMIKEQPTSLTGGKLMDYQIEGLNWLLFQWHRQQNAILADEMGLGKTIQIIGFLATLQASFGCWPFLIVVPNSTCANWRREIKQWAPSLRVVTYFGSSEARRMAHRYELFPNKTKTLACHIVVTSYDAAQDVNVQTVLRRIPWQGLIVDEGQRLKNDKNILYSALTSLKAPFKILLTGTPLQNNQRELFNLLQFLDNSVNAQALEEEYATLTKDNVPELHELLRPFFLRRTKAQVLTFLPPMAQVIVPVTPTALQKQLYKSILAKNPELLRSIFGGDRKTAVRGLRNLLMQLRKCLCHPFVYSIAIEERSSNATVSHRRLVEASSKLQLLELMLPKLKERGHRVLIFSQFLDMITIVEDFLDGLGLLHQRLDGTMGSLEKQKRIDEFNAPDSPLFALLLSTRAGGVGINLATADTVIILDPDFNPHQDIQAISRAHRIGQKRKVLIFQLMTRGTAEEKIMQIGKKKMALDHVLIEQMDADDADSNDLESVLRFGAEALFKDDSKSDIHYDSASVDKLLDRSQIEDTKTGKDSSAESQFSFARVWANDKGTMEDSLGASSDDDQVVPDQTVWDKILQERARQAAQQGFGKAEALGRGKRQRRAIDYTKQTANVADLGSPGKSANHSDSDTDFQARGESEVEESAIEDTESVGADELHSPEARPSRSSLIPPTSPSAKTGKFSRVPEPRRSQTHASTGQVPCIACSDQYGSHAVGYCPLKLAGPEYCNLCGLAHFGIGRQCPHMNNEIQVSIMLNSLKESPESKDLVDRARKYLSGVKGDLVSRKKKKAAKAFETAAGNAHMGNATTGSSNREHSHPRKVRALADRGDTLPTNPRAVHRYLPGDITRELNFDEATQDENRPRSISRYPTSTWDP